MVIIFVCNFLRSNTGREASSILKINIPMLNGRETLQSTPTMGTQKTPKQVHCGGEGGCGMPRPGCVSGARSSGTSLPAASLHFCYIPFTHPLIDEWDRINFIHGLAYGGFIFVCLGKVVAFEGVFITKIHLLVSSTLFQGVLVFYPIKNIIPM